MQIYATTTTTHLILPIVAVVQLDHRSNGVVHVEAVVGACCLQVSGAARLYEFLRLRTFDALFERERAFGVGVAVQAVAGAGTDRAVGLVEPGCCPVVRSSVRGQTQHTCGNKYKPRVGRSVGRLATKS